MKPCVIIPTYNESQAISKIVKEIKVQGFDVLVIDDGSKDNTPQLAKEGGAIVLVNETNMGKGASLKKGFEYALRNGYDSVITMDGDGQHLPEDIPYFMRLAQYSNSGIIIGNRMQKTRNMPMLRLLTNRFMSWLISIVAKQKIPDSQCGFRLIKKEVLERIKITTSNFEIESEILIKGSRMGFKIESVPIKTVYAGELSRINPVTDTIRFFRFLIREAWNTKN